MRLWDSPKLRELLANNVSRVFLQPTASPQLNQQEIQAIYIPPAIPRRTMRSQLSDDWQHQVTQKQVQRGIREYEPRLAKLLYDRHRGLCLDIAYRNLAQHCRECELIMLHPWQKHLTFDPGGN
jgi:hypothetical protein